MCRTSVVSEANEMITFVSCTAECLPGRTVSQCFCRWDRVLNPAIVKGTWTKEVKIKYS